MIGLDLIDALQAKMRIEAERDMEVAREQAAGDVEVARMKKRQRVAKEARQACTELAEARKAALQEIAKNQEAAQQGVNISPVITTLLQNVVAKLTDAESYSGGLL